MYPPLSSKPFISVPRLEEQEITKPGGGGGAYYSIYVRVGNSVIIL